MIIQSDMKNFTKVLLVCGLMVGGVMFATNAQAQSESTASEKAVTVSTVNDAPAVKKKACCASMATKSCTGKTSAMGGNVTETSANAGTVEGGKNKKAKKACCASKSAQVGGNVTGTSASAGSTKATSKKACTSEKKACCKSKGAKMSSAETK
jgi:hypothetical protein